MSANATEILSVAAGGALGCVGRYAMEHVAFFSQSFSSTIVTNISGCLLIGILWSVFSHTGISDLWSRFAITGLLGGFTKFSAFSLHPILMIRDGMWVNALTYVVLTVVGGIIACMFGIWCTERIIRLS